MVTLLVTLSDSRMLQLYSCASDLSSSETSVWYAAMSTSRLSAVREMEAWMKTTQNPHDEGFFMYGDQKSHCWSGPGTSADHLRGMAEYGLRKKPAGTGTPWWKH